jgi:uncharacterized protein YndB with AHSA1/START domain
VSDVTASITIDAPPEAVFPDLVEPELLGVLRTAANG